MTWVNVTYRYNWRGHVCDMRYATYRYGEVMRVTYVNATHRYGEVVCGDLR